MNPSGEPGNSQDESYFAFTARWLASQPARTREAQAAARLKRVRVVSQPLADYTRNRIRAARADWQRLRWRVRHKVTDTVMRLEPGYHEDGIHGLVAAEHPNHRLTLAHTLGDRLRLRASLAFLNKRVDHKLSPRCYGNRPNGSSRCTDRRTALRRFRKLVWNEQHSWVAKLDVKKFYDTLPHEPVLDALEAAVRDRGCVREIKAYMAWYWEQCWPGHASPPPDPVRLPQGSPVSAVLANIYMTQFDHAVTAAGIEHIRFLDDVTIMARSAEQLAAQLEFAMKLITDLKLEVASKKTRVAYLGAGSPPALITLPTSGEHLKVHGEFDELGVHFYASGDFRARHRTVNRLLSKVRRVIRRDRGRKSPQVRYLRATATINLMLGYKVSVRRPGVKPMWRGGALPKPPAAYPAVSRRVRVRLGPSSYGPSVVFRRVLPIIGSCWISGVKYVQPRQHALLGHSDLILAQMHRVDRLIRRWMKNEFETILCSRSLTAVEKTLLRGRRVRSAAKMFEMAVREPMPRCPPGAP